MKLNSSSLFISTILTIALIVIMTIASELAPAFKDFLVSFAGHHWVAKGIISLAFFVVTYLTFRKIKEDPTNIVRHSLLVLGSVVAGVFVILGFYILHFFGVFS